MMYEQLQDDLNEKTFRSYRERRKPDGWEKQMGTDRLNHLIKLVTRTRAHEELTLHNIRCLSTIRRDWNKKIKDW